MNEQPLTVEVNNEIVVELIEQNLEMEVEFSVVSPEQINLIESIRNETLVYKERAIEAESSSRNSAIKSDNSETMSKKFMDKTEALKNGTEQIKSDTNKIKESIQTIHTQTDKIKSDTNNLKNQTSDLYSKTQKLRDETNELKIKAWESAEFSQRKAEDSANSQKEAAESESEALDSENMSYEHRQAAEESNKSAQSARTIAVEAKDETITARNLARKWATEDEGKPVQDNNFSALHWARFSEHIANTLTNGMFFSGSWDLADGFPKEPNGPLVPWYRLTGTDTSSIQPVNSRLDKLASSVNKGDQLVWDPIKREWFTLDTSDQVWLVNGKKGDVVLNANDVGAVGNKGTQTIDGTLINNENRLSTINSQKYTNHYGRFFTSGPYTYLVDRNAEVGLQQTGIRFRQGNPVLQCYHAVYGEETQIWDIYHSGYRPTPEDINAYPISGGRVDGNVTFAKGQGITCDINNQVRSGASSDSLLIIGGNNSRMIRLVSGKVSVSDNINNSGSELYHENNKPKPSDIGALATSGGILTGNLALPGNNAGITDFNNNRLLACHNGKHCKIGQAYVHENITLYGVNNLSFRVYYEGKSMLIYHEGQKPTPSDIGAEPELAMDRKRKITISTNEPYGGSDGDIWFQVDA